MTVQSAILDPTSIVDAIRIAMPDLRAVGTVASLAKLKLTTIAWPSAYVIVLGERAGENRFQSEHVLSQRVTARFGVIWAVRDIGSRHGTVANADIRTIREIGMLAITGHRVGGSDGLCMPVSGQLVSGVDKKGQMLWQDDFTVPLNRNIPKT